MSVSHKKLKEGEGGKSWGRAGLRGNNRSTQPEEGELKGQGEFEILHRGMKKKGTVGNLIGSEEDGILSTGAEDIVQ